eukprot:5737013-Prymnesium_polylepis.2
MLHFSPSRMADCDSRDSTRFRPAPAYPTLTHRLPIGRVSARTDFSGDCWWSDCDPRSAR